MKILLMKLVERNIQQSTYLKWLNIVKKLVAEGKTIIIDSKMSLTDYERYFSAENPEEQQQAIKRHVQSIRKHIRQLSDKDYHNLYDIGSLDFVLMFIPIEFEVFGETITIPYCSGSEQVGAPPADPTVVDIFGGEPPLPAITRLGPGRPPRE